MDRQYYSASQVSQASRCLGACAYQYIDKIREPEVLWDDIEQGIVEFTWSQRSKALGKAVHERVQGAFDPLGYLDSRGIAGEMALSAMPFLPYPGDCAAQIELSIGRTPNPYRDSENAPETGAWIKGAFWVGFIDLLLEPNDAEWVRLGIDPVSRYLLVDLKTTSSLAYVPTPEQLRVDLQACVYAFATCERLGLGAIDLRWVYVLKGKTRLATAVDVTITRDQALAVVLSYSGVIRDIQRLRDSDSAPRDNRECGMFGGCYYHCTNGGPCTVRRHLGALIQGRKKKGVTLFTRETKNAFAAAKKAAEEAADNAPEEFEEGLADLEEGEDYVDAEGEEEPPEPEPPPPPPPAQPRRGRGRPPGARNKPKADAQSSAAPVDAVAGSAATPSDDVLELIEAFTQAKKSLTAAKLDYEVARTNLCKALEL